MATPTLWLVAGANGSGKTSAVAKVAGQLDLHAVINPDKLAERLRAQAVDKNQNFDVLAAEQIEKDVAREIISNHSVAVETVLSSDKYLPHIHLAKERSYIVSMLYVAVRSPDISVDRVRTRVSQGGHDVPEDKIRDRWVRSHDRLGRFYPLFDTIVVMDNTTEEATMVAYKAGNVLTLYERGRLPAVEAALAPYLSAAKIA